MQPSVGSALQNQRRSPLSALKKCRPCGWIATRICSPTAGSACGATRMVTVSRLDIHELTVPRILREVHTECHRCPKCFEPEPDGRPERPQVKFDGRSNLDASAFRRKGATKNVELSDFL